MRCQFIEDFWDKVKHKCPSPLYHQGSFVDWIANIKIQLIYLQENDRKIAIIIGNILSHQDDIIFEESYLNPSCVWKSVVCVSFIFR